MNNKQQLKIIKKIKKAYNKLFKSTAKDFVKHSDFGLDLFISYLHYIRDLYLAKIPLSETKVSNQAFTMLCTAITEFDAYLESAIYAYMLKELNTPDTVVKDDEKNISDLEATEKKYNTELKLHWTAFWKLCSLYFNDWLSLIEEDL